MFAVFAHKTEVIKYFQSQGLIVGLALGLGLMWVLVPGPWLWRIVLFQHALDCYSYLAVGHQHPLHPFPLSWVSRVRHGWWWWQRLWCSTCLSCRHRLVSCWSLVGGTLLLCTTGEELGSDLLVPRRLDRGIAWNCTFISFFGGERGGSKKQQMERYVNLRDFPFRMHCLDW